MRCKGRLENADLSEGARHPIILPKNDRITHIIIDKTHKQILHSGVSQTLSKIRHTYWIPQGRATVRTVVNKCQVCRRQEGGPYKVPPMPPLPKTRVTDAYLF